MNKIEQSAEISMLKGRIRQIHEDAEKNPEFWFGSQRLPSGEQGGPRIVALGAYEKRLEIATRQT